MKKKLLLLVLMLSFLGLLAGCSDNPDSVKKYVLKKYGIHVEILSKPRIDEGNMGEDAYEVRDVKEPGMVFKVYTKGLFINKITGDNYKKLIDNYNKIKGYQKSDIYRRGLEKGIHTIAFNDINTENTKGGPVVSVALLKDRALELSDSNIADLYEVYTNVVDYYSGKLVVSGAEITDTNNFRSTNITDLHKHADVNEDNSATLEIEGKVSFEEFKQSFLSDAGREAVITYFYKKDHSVMEKLKPQLASLGFDINKKLPGFRLECQDFDGIKDEKVKDLQMFDLTVCHNYEYTLDYKVKSIDGFTNEEASNFYKAIELLKSTNLNIDSVFANFEDKEQSSRGTLIYLKDINSLEDAREAL